MIAHLMFCLLVLILMVILAAPIGWLLFSMYFAPRFGMRRKLIMLDGLGCVCWDDEPYSVERR
jgi:hypothetical protein